MSFSIFISADEFHLKVSKAVIGFCVTSLGESVCGFCGIIIGTVCMMFQ